MLLLSITVILFASIFFFISKFPKPGPQPLSQFDATLAYTGSTVHTISILHLSGTALSGTSTTNAAIDILSQRHPNAIPSPFTLQAGLGGSSTWTFGQTWSINMTSYGITAPDNLTVSIVSAGQLQYQSILPVTTAAYAPYFTTVVVSPTGVIAAAHAFTVNATAFFATTSGNSVTINTTEFPSGGSHSMTLTGGLYQYSGTTPSPSSQTTYYLFLVATDGNGVKTTLSVSVTVA